MRKKLRSLIQMIGILTMLCCFSLLNSCGENNDSVTDPNDQTEQVPEEEENEEQNPEEEQPEEQKPEEGSPLTPINPTFQMDQDPNDSQKEWSLVEIASDEFNGSQLDANKWTADPQANGWEWLGRVPQLFMQESVSVGDGTMQILVGALDEPIERESYGTTHTYSYHGGIIRSQTPAAKVGYYYECRLKMGKTEMGGGFWLNVHPTARPQRHEIDIQESIGAESELMTDWQRKTAWNRIMHSNAIDTTGDPKTKDSNYVNMETLNSENFHVYGAWWKSPTEIVCFLDGKYIYTLTPPVPFPLDSYVQFSIEMYDWNKIPDDGGLVKSLPEEDRIYHYDWVRIWELK